jgi:Na+-transporting NADH:ubiquinone oxidoreductase subunit B
MKFIENQLESIKDRYFAKGRKFHKLWPLFDGIDTFLFSPRETIHEGPHIRDSLDNKRFMTMVILALHPPMLFGIYNAGLQSLGSSAALGDILWQGLGIFLPVLIVSYGVGLFWEFLFCILKGHSISEGYLVSGMLIALMLPPTIPLWMMVVAVTFGVILGKEVFGGSGMNILNPALTVRAFLYFTYPGAMTGNAVWVADSKGGVTGATILNEAQSVTQAFYGQLEEYYRALKNAMAAGLDTILVDGQPVLPPVLPEPLVQDGVFRSPGLTVTFNDLLMGFHAGSLGETSIIAILLGAVLLIASRVGSWRTMLSVVVGGYVTALVYNMIGASQVDAYREILAAGSLKEIASMGEVFPNLYFNVPAHYHLVSGGFMFAAIFMATDPVSSPGRKTSKYIYGFLIGMLTVVVRVSNPAYPEGVMMAVLFMNIFAPTIDYYVVESRLKKRAARHA